MNLTYFQPRKRRIVENNNNCPLNIRFVAKTSDIRNFSQNIRSGNTVFDGRVARVVYDDIHQYCSAADARIQREI